MQDTPSTIYKARIPPGWDSVSLLFLDIDGPCNCVKTWPNGVKPHKPGSDVDHLIGIDRQLMPLVNQISEAPHVLTVISSSWGKNHGFDQTEDTLIRAGWRGVIIGGTGIAQKRYLEIGRFLTDWQEAQLPKIASFVIVDDDETMGPLTDHLVSVHPLNGINVQDIERALTLLSPTGMVHP